MQQRILNYENAIKVWRNQLAALSDDSQMERKQASENELREAVQRKRSLRKSYGSAWDDVDRALASYRQFEDRYRFIEGGYGFMGSLWGYARTLVRLGNKPGAQSVWYLDAQDRVLAVDAMNDPRAYMAGKRWLEAGGSPTPAQIEDTAADLLKLAPTG